MTFPFPSFGPHTAAASVSTITFVSQANINATSITTPTALAGDLAIFFDGPSNSTASIPALVSPSGWTLINEVSTVGAGADGVRTAMWYKVLVSGDLGASVTGMAGTGVSRKVMAIFRPDIPITTVSLPTPGGQATTGVPTTQTIAAPSAPSILIGQARGIAIIVGSGTLRTSGTALTTSGNSQEVYYEIQNGSFASRTYGMGDTGDFNTLQSSSITLI